MKTIHSTSSKLTIKSSLFYEWLLSEMVIVATIILMILLLGDSLILPDVDVNPQILLLITLFINLPFVLLLLKPTTIVEFDKSNQLFTITRQWLWTQKLEVYPFEQIVTVKAKGFPAVNNGPSFRLIMTLASGNNFPLSSKYYRPEQLIRDKELEIQNFIS